MAPSKIKLKRSATAMSERDSSPELGDEPNPDTIRVKRHKNTGKPIRESAGRRSLPSGFVDSQRAIEENDPTYMTDGLESDEDDVDDDIEKPKSRPAKRHISPPPRALSPSFEPETTELSSGAPVLLPAQELSLTFNVPPGHTGAFIVKLDLGTMLGTTPLRTSPGTSANSASSRASTILASFSTPSSSTTRSSPPSTCSSKPKRVGFLNLPPELRNIIYRHTFVTKEPIDFYSRSNFSHCGAFLATCHQIYEEGREILYGENDFKFVRDKEMRGHYYDSTWSEIGWKDVRRFLTHAGPTNISLLRKVAITFEDPSMSARTRLGMLLTYVNDDHLMECLKLLARHGLLQKLTLAFHGRSMVKRQDVRFLENLKDIKADKVEIVADNHGRLRGRYGGYGSRRVANLALGLDMEIIAAMRRKEKLYGNN